MAGEARAWIDGAARGNPGEAGFGVLLRHDGQVEEMAGFLGRTTNNVAEYAALVAALTLALRRGRDQILLHSDSQLLVRQIEGRYRVKAPHLIPIFLKVLALKRHFRSFEIRHLPRERNRDADRLANRAIDERSPLPQWLELELPQA